MRSLAQCLRPGVAALVVVTGLLSGQAAAEDVYFEDSYGNINQRSIGVLNSERFSGSELSAGVEIETRNLPAFSQLSLSIPAELYYRDGGPGRIEIEGPPELVASVSTTVTAGVLRIASSRRQLGRLRISVSGRGLRGAEVMSAADAVLEHLSGYSFDLKLGGASEVTLSGRAESCSIRASGASELNQADLICNELRMQAQGAVDLEVHAGSRIEGQLQGAGDLLIHGSPAIRKITTVGAFDVEYDQ